MTYYPDDTPVGNVDWPPTLYSRICHAAKWEKWDTVGDLRGAFKERPYCFITVPNLGRKSANALEAVAKSRKEEGVTSKQEIEAIFERSQKDLPGLMEAILGCVAVLADRVDALEAKELEIDAESTE